MMLEELQGRHYSGASTLRYIRFIERFAQHFHCSPDRLGPRQIHGCQAQLFTMHKLPPGFSDQPSLRPALLIHPDAQEALEHCRHSEVARLIDAAPTPFYRTILMTLDGTGVRRTELTRLKVSDIDSRRMACTFKTARVGKTVT